MKLFTQNLYLGSAAAALLFCALSTVSRGQDVFVSNFGNNSITSFNGQTGQPIPGFNPPSFAPEASGGTFADPTGLAVSGNTVYAIGSANTGGGIIREYDLGSGAETFEFNPGNLNSAQGIAVSNSDIYVANSGNGAITAYNPDGTPLSSFGSNGSVRVAGSEPFGIAVSGNDLFVAGFAANEVYEYNATTGALLNSLSIAGPYGLAVSGTDLYVTSYTQKKIDEIGVDDSADSLTQLVYNSPTLQGPAGIAVLGNDLFVAAYGNSTLGEYDATTGAAVSTFKYPTLPNGDEPTFIAVAVPEPGGVATYGCGVILLAGWRRLLRKV